MTGPNQSEICVYDSRSRDVLGEYEILDIDSLSEVTLRKRYLNIDLKSNSND